MEDLLSIFEAQQRRRKRKDQQPMLDLAEAGRSFEHVE